MNSVRLLVSIGIAVSLVTLNGCADSGPKEAPKRSSQSYNYGGYAETPALPEIPEDINQWQPQDYANAKTQNHARLAEAVRSFGDRHKGDATAVPLLVQLFTQTAPAEGTAAGGGGYGGYGGYPSSPGYGAAGGESGDVGGAIVHALVVNNTEEARAELMKVLQGTFPSIMEDGPAVNAVLTELAAAPSEVHQEILFTAATSPQSFRGAAATPPANAVDGTSSGVPSGPDGQAVAPGYGYGGASGPSYGYGGTDEGSPLAAGSSVTPATLQQAALLALEPTADAATRTRMAELAVGKPSKGLLGGIASRLGSFAGYAKSMLPIGGSSAGGNVDEESRRAIIDFLSRPHPDNLEAQLMIYQSPLADESAKAQLEGIFLSQSSSALQTLLGLSVGAAPDLQSTAGAYGAGYGAPGPGGFGPGNNPGAAFGGYGQGVPPSAGFDPYGQAAGSFERPAETSMTQQQAERIAGLLWGGKFARVVAGRVPKKGTSEPNPDTMLLAGSMVSPAVRQAFADVSYVRQDEAPALFRDLGFFQQSMADPGLLPILKPYANMTPRRPRRGEDRQARGTTDDYGGGSGTARPSEEVSDYENLLDTVMARFAASSSVTPNLASSLPFELPEGAEIQGGTVIDWSDGKLGNAQIAPLKVCYVRVRQQIEQYKIEGFYRRKAHRAKIHETDDKVWIDGLERTPATGTVRSVDIIITRQGDPSSRETSAAPTGDSEGRRVRRTPEPETFLVDVLLVEIPDIKSTLEPKSP
jgi:hypothetical protein